jgi:uncharacterized protein YlxP (DUF503 family)
VFVAALAIELRLRDCRSLKAKRSVVRPLVEGVRRRYQVAVAEVGRHDAWQRATIGVAAVGGDEAHVRDVLDEVERFVWSWPEIEVLDASRTWMEEDR